MLLGHSPTGGRRELAPPRGIVQQGEHLVGGALHGELLGFGLLRGQSYLRYLMEEMLPMAQEGWMTFTRRFVVFYLCLAVLNEARPVRSLDLYEEEKAVLLEGLPADGFAVLDLDDEQFEVLRAHASAPVVTCSMRRREA